MTSVERIVHYAEDIEQEAPHYVDKVTVPADWPSEGRIVLRDVVMKYRPELPPVLRGLNMAVIPREKIGIVGRSLNYCSPCKWRGELTTMQNWSGQVVYNDGSIPHC